MGRTGRRAAAVATLGVGVVALLGFGAHGTRAQADAGTRAIEYLEGQQSAADGSLPGGYSVNELYAIGAAAGGYDPNLLRHGGPSVIDYLGANAASACPATSATAPSAGGCGELIQAAVAAAKDAHAFGGLDLISRLDTYYDPSTGKYGDGEAFTQALAIQGLVAAGQPVPGAALTFVHTAEDGDGGWDYLDVANDPNAASNYDTSDSNSTAMVLMALDAAGDHSRDATALTWLHSLQNTDGGFSFQGGGSDPDSTALVLQAIIASGGSPAGAAWTVNGNTPASELVATQDPSGGYTFPGNAGPDAFTTAQVPPALDGVAYPVPSASTLYVAGTPLGGQPPAPAPTPAPTSSPIAGVDNGSPPGPAQPGSAAVAPPAGFELGRTVAAQTYSGASSGESAASSGSTAPATASTPAATPAPTPAPTSSPAPSTGAPSHHAVAAPTPAPGGPPAPLLYALAALAAAALVGGTGYLVTRT
jgi:hypothetical protein